jgi:addiction module HigA family antidote
MKKPTKKRVSKNRIPIENYAAEVLRETLEDIGVSQAEVARATGIPAPHLSEMKKGRRRFTPEVDLRFSRYFGITPGYFLRLQLRFDLETVTEEAGERVEKEVIPA